jgi:hypothetical protein
LIWRQPSWANEKARCTSCDLGAALRGLGKKAKLEELHPDNINF